VFLAIVAGLCFVLNSSAQGPSPSVPEKKPAATTASSVSEQPTTSNEKGQPASAGPCDIRKAQDCGVSKQDLKKARAAFQRGNQLKASNPEEALESFEQAVQLVPRSPEYLTAREMVRQQLAYEHLRQANELLSRKQTVESANEFRKVLEFDSGNQTASDGLRQIARAALPEKASFVQPSPGDDELSVKPRKTLQNFHLSGDPRMLFSAVASAFGIKADFDRSMRSGQIRLDLDQTDFNQAMETLCALARSFWTPVSSTEIMIAADTPTAHKELDRWMLRTFYLPEIQSAQELNDVVNLLRTIFDVRFVTQQPATNTITVRAAAPVMKVATRFLESLAAGRPEVMIDFDVFQVNRQMLQTIGTDLPLQFNVFNIPAAALAALGSSNIQDLINQLLSSGNISQANLSSLSALVAQLQNQQNSLFSTPVATFGGGKTLMGIAVPPATVQFSRNESRMIGLEHLSMRASHGNTATLRLGSRYPTLNASYSSITPLSGVSGLPSSVSSLLASTTAYPSFSYEDLGITLTAKPSIHGSSNITLDLDMQLRSLAGQSLNSIPIIAQRAYKGIITVKNGEPAVVAGAVSQTEMRSLSGIPGIGRLPVLSAATSTRGTEHDESELLILITPHIVREGQTGSTNAILMPVTGQ
jgi:type II secretory pathway component GspD/PulD (secretin)